MRCLDKDFQVGTIFHVYNHATDGQLLFYDDQDYEYFKIVFGMQLQKISASIIAYCLMPNHYHFLIRQNDEAKIYKIFNYAFVSYARYYNKKYKRKGRIFRTPLQHKIVDDNTYLIQLCKYIHLNPVKAGLVDQPEDWEYSNYKEWVKMRDGKFYSKDICKDLFPNIQDYITYVKSFCSFIRDTSFDDLLVNLD